MQRCITFGGDVLQIPLLEDHHHHDIRQTSIKSPFLDQLLMVPHDFHQFFHGFSLFPTCCSMDFSIFPRCFYGFPPGFPPRRAFPPHRPRFYLLPGFHRARACFSNPPWTSRGPSHFVIELILVGGEMFHGYVSSWWLIYIYIWYG